MLPEQIEMLEQLDREQDRKEKPIIDEQMKAEHYIMLQDALENDSKIRIKYYANYDHIIEEGFLLSIDAVNGIVYMEEMNIKFDDIIEVNLF